MDQEDAWRILDDEVNRHGHNPMGEYVDNAFGDQRLFWILLVTEDSRVLKKLSGW